MKKVSLLLCLLLLATSLLAGASSSSNAAAQRTVRPRAATPRAVEDVHSYSNPAEVRVRHVDLDWDVLFDQKILKGSATLTIERTARGRNAPLILDTRNLGVTRVETSEGGSTWREAQFAIGTNDAILGAPLTVQLPARADRVRVHYTTSPSASGLQWLEPAQTAGKRLPFMFTQSQAIHARSWIPLQDTPQGRVTYTARVRTPRELLAVMSAENDPRAARDGDYSFRMTQAVPAYLIALAVGDLRFRAMGRRTAVYAEPSVVERAAREFADTEKMISATEKLYGPYRWGRYDILVLPPSFPFGGMENPRLTFATPTILAGDKSLVSLVAHELAHSWSGNLVTNATWSDFWLNEGFTVFFELRIMEALYGRERASMLEVLGRRELTDEIARLGATSPDTILHMDLEGRDPDDGMTDIAYQKGAAFLHTVESIVGRERLDAFLREYFDEHAFEPMTSESFLEYMNQELFAN